MRNILGRVRLGCLRPTPSVPSSNSSSFHGHRSFSTFLNLSWNPLGSSEGLVVCVMSASCLDVFPEKSEMERKRSSYLDFDSAQSGHGLAHFQASCLQRLGSQSLDEWQIAAACLGRCERGRRRRVSRRSGGNTRTAHLTRNCFLNHRWARTEWEGR